MEKSKTEYVKDYILLKILNDIYKINTKIPSEKELCLKLHVSRQTVKNAISILKASGWLYSSQGKGHYVRDDSSFFAHDLSTYLNAPKTEIQILDSFDPLTKLIDSSQIENPLFYVKKYFGKHKQFLAYSLCVLSKFNAWNITIDDLKSGLIKSLKNHNVQIHRMDQRIIINHNLQSLKEIALALGFNSVDFPIIETQTFRRSGELIEKSIVLLARHKALIKKQIFF